MGYQAVVLIGAVIVFVDGQLILKHSPGYLDEVYDDPRKARQATQMVTLLFHLLMLGVVLLVASGMEPNPTVPQVLHRLGSMLILAGIGHALTMIVLSRLRDQQLATALADAATGTPADPATEPATPAPRPDTQRRRFPGRRRGKRHPADRRTI